MMVQEGDAMNTPPLAIVAGAGPGLGQRLVAYLNAHGYRAFGLSRSVPAGAGADTLVCDLTNPARHLGDT